MALPMMAEKKLVEVRSLDFKSLKKDDVANLCEALESLAECDHTVLVIRADSHLFDAGTQKKPSELFKKLSAYLTPVEFAFPTPTELSSWVLRHFVAGGVEFDPGLSRYLIETCGQSMWALANEIEKLCAYAKQNHLPEIKREHIDLVCCKSIEYSDFQLTNKLLEGSVGEVFETLRRQKLNHENPHLLLSAVIRMYTDLYAVCRLQSMGLSKSQIATSLKMHEFKVGAYLSKIARTSSARIERGLELCRDADLQSKSAMNLDAYGALERLISTLCML
jgi:DNA polymerase-3 subunit delta